MDEKEYRRRRLEQYSQQESDQTIQKQFEMIESMVRQRMTKEALQRYGNIRAAHPEKAIQLVAILGQAIQDGQINNINDAELKEILSRMTNTRKTKITIK